MWGVGGGCRQRKQQSLTPNSAAAVQFPLNETMAFTVQCGAPAAVRCRTQSHLCSRRNRGEVPGSDVPRARMPELIPSHSANEVIRLGLNHSPSYTGMGGARLDGWGVIQIAFGPRLYPD